MANTTLPNYPSGTFKFNNLGEVITGILPFIMVIAGLSMFFILIMGGFGVMTSAGDPGKLKVGYGKITASLIGFGIIFLSYLIVQVVEIMLGVKIF